LTRKVDYASLSASEAWRQLRPEQLSTIKFHRPSPAEAGELVPTPATRDPGRSDKGPFERECPERGTWRPGDRVLRRTP